MHAIRAAVFASAVMTSPTSRRKLPGVSVRAAIPRIPVAGSPDCTLPGSTNGTRRHGMSRRTDQRNQLDRIEQTLSRMEGRLAKLENVLDVSTPGGLSSVAADAKGARSSAEAAFAGVQAL